MASTIAYRSMVVLSRIQSFASFEVSIAVDGTPWQQGWQHGFSIALALTAVNGSPKLNWSLGHLGFRV